MRLRHSLLIASAILAAVAVGAARADLNYTQGSGTVLFDFICFTTKHCTAHVPINSAGTEIGTTINPMQVGAPSGSIASGAMVDLGAQADSVCGSATGSCSMIALLKYLNNVASAAIPAGSNTIGKVGIDQTTPGTTNGVTQTDGTNTAKVDPCQSEAATFTPVNIAASGSTRIITGVSAKKVYICHLHIVAAAADNVALTEGTGTNCGTGTAGMAGGTSAASGWNFSANSGISLGMGGFSVMATATNANDVCLNPSSATQLSGHVKWVAR